jgi:YD repeat-containing protein
MKNLLAILFLSSTITVQSQFYYNDILGTQEITQRIKIYTANKVVSVSATGFDGEGIKKADFFEIQEVKSNGRMLKVSAFNEKNKITAYYLFDEQGRLSKLTDSVKGVTSISEYKYDNAGKLISILNTGSDAENEFNQTEEHQWFYSAKGQPEKMRKIMNGRDSVLYEISIDENNNVADEHLVRNGVKYDPLYYYYYDADNRLTDIARYNKIARKILPDFMFEYDNQNRVIQKIATVSGAQIGYVYFRYGFNDKGLKTKEVLFNKLKYQTGRIDYEYSFGN